MLAKSFPINDPTKLSVLLLSNEKKTIALAHQRASDQGKVIIWDYHVVLYNQLTQEIFDYDTRLNFPERIQDYLINTFGDQENIPENYQTHCRELPADVYLKSFDSDRTHMLSTDGMPLQNFPTWPPIRSKEPITLMQLIDFNFKAKQIPNFKPIYDLLK